MIQIGLDNGIYVRSNKRPITREMLPSVVVCPFNRDYEDGAVEILYWRKNWGLRNAVMNELHWRESEDQYKFEIDTPAEVMQFIAVIASFLSEEKWEEDGDSIWDYSEIRWTLIQNIINLSAMVGFMEQNPDVYLEFYDSY